MGKKLPAELTRALKNAAGLRIPDEDQPLILLSIDLASILLGYKLGRVPDNAAQHALIVAENLRVAAKLYYRAADWEALKPRSRGRSKNLADSAFIFAMHDVLSSAGLSGFAYDRRKGVEQPTPFQRLCQLWMDDIDPERTVPLRPAAFKDAKRRRRSTDG